MSCRRCGLLYANPRPVPDTLADHYEKPPEEYWRDAQLDHNDSASGLWLDPFWSHWHGAAKPSALDIGAGLGQTMRLLAERGFDVYGFEPSAAFRAGAIDRGVDPTRLQLASIENAAYEPGAFDLVWFGAVLEHLQDPGAALVQAFHWVSPRGAVFVEVPSARWLMARLLNTTYRLRGLDYVTNLSPMHDPYHLYEFTLRSFELHGVRHRYTVGASQILPCETFLPKPAEAIAQRLMAATNTGMQLQVWLMPTGGSRSV